MQTGVVRPDRHHDPPAELLDALSDGGAPSTADQLQSRFEKFLQKVTRGKEQSKVRLVIERTENPGGQE